MTRDPHRLRAYLRAGGVIAYATEAVFGLGCDPWNPRGVRRILRLKGRPQAQGLILVAADFAQLAPFVAPLSPAARAAATQHWPGPTTLLLPASKRCPRWLTGRHETVAVRVTAHRDAIDLCRAAAMALVSTSANRAGQRPARSTRDCIRRFGRSVGVIPGRVGKRKRPSTLLEPETGRVLRA